MKHLVYVLKSTGKVIGVGSCEVLDDSIFSIESSEDIYNDIRKDDLDGKEKYIYDSGKGLVINPDYENILRAKEKERISNLSMTPLDFIKVLEIRAGITYEQIKSLCDKYSMIDRELRFCQNVYRNNPMFSQESLAQLPSEFHLTDGELDDLFIYVDNLKQSNQTI